MKKQKKWSDWNLTQVTTKEAELIKEWVTFRVSEDSSVLKHLGGVVALRRDLRILSRLKAQLQNPVEVKQP